MYKKANEISKEFAKDEETKDKSNKSLSVTEKIHLKNLIHKLSQKD